MKDSRIYIFKGLANFVMLFYKEKPVDWLLENYLSTKVCSPEKSDKECASSKNKIKVTFPFLFMLYRSVDSAHEKTFTVPARRQTF